MRRIWAELVGVGCRVHDEPGGQSGGAAPVGRVDAILNDGAGTDQGATSAVKLTQATLQ